MKRVIDKPHGQSAVASRFVQCTKIAAAFIAVAAWALGTVAIVANADISYQNKLVESISQE